VHRHPSGIQLVSALAHHTTHPQHHILNSSQGISGKGALLTQLSAHWFDLIRTNIPSLQLHIISLSLPPSIPAETQPLLANRSMQVRRHPILPIESIVRGYITGSAWAEYRASGTVNGMRLAAGLRESQKLETAIWTPSTKAEAGEHDENISKERAGEILGEEVAGRVEGMSLRLYEMVGGERTYPVKYVSTY